MKDTLESTADQRMQKNESAIWKTGLVESIEGEQQKEKN